GTSANAVLIGVEKASRIGFLKPPMVALILSLCVTFKSNFIVSSLSLLVCGPVGTIDPLGSTGISPLAIKFTATGLNFVGSMIAQAAFAASAWKNVWPCRKAATPGSRLGHAAGPGDPLLPAVEKSPFSASAGVNTVTLPAACFWLNRCPWYPTKKKKRSLPFTTWGSVIGPPNVPPY